MEKSVEQTEVDKISKSEGSENELTVYEFGYHLLPSLSENEVAKEATDVQSFIENLGGVVIAFQSPKPMRLAYTMTKKQDGKNIKFDTSFFSWIKFEIMSEQAKRLHEELYGSKSVLRFLLIKTIREDTTIHHRPIMRKIDEEPKIIQKKVKPTDEEVKGTPLSEAELDKTIEELVA